MYKFILFGIVTPLLFVGACVSTSAYYVYGTDEYVQCTVEKSERVVEGSSSKYLIFCTEEVFQNSDSLWYWKWNSSDFYRDIREGESYRFKVYGWRIPFFSMYRNIIEI